MITASRRRSYQVLVIYLLAIITKSQGIDVSINYVVKGFLSDGEQEVHMRIGDIIVQETLITHETVNGSMKGLMLRQVALGPDFIQLIYKSHEELLPSSKHMKLSECEAVNDWDAADAFRQLFNNKIHALGLHLDVPISNNSRINQDKSNDIIKITDSINEAEGLEMKISNELELIDLSIGTEQEKNVTVRILGDTEITKDMRKAANIKAHKRRCKRLHRHMKQIVTAKSQPNLGDDNGVRIRREAFRVGIMPGTLWCGDGSLADKYEAMGAHVGADRCCREHDGCPFLIDAMSSKYGLFNYRMHTISHCTCDERKRQRRDANTALNMPGTQWCGRGFSAEDVHHLGGFTGTDNCCRYHDMGCPFYIESFQEKYGLFNWRMYTINHCTCDERFRSCLKQTNTGASNFVGKIFFNVVQTKCFLLKPEKGCAKMSWWGKCLKYEFKKQAYLRDPIPY